LRRAKARKVKKQEPVTQALTFEQARKLLSVARDDPLEALYVLALTTGLRQGELLALKWSDLDLTYGTLQVHGYFVLSTERLWLQAFCQRTCASILGD
jgi:integrase